ncbi:MAG: peptide chain release factor-like protein [Candidatus Omnitrophica bacterium]|nr:peptide chain release factor-like protein [Candidatus Omnitrophota bacterium]
MEFGISPAKEKELKDKMSRLGIREEDLTERFLRSGGPGGQHVNKVSSCVYLKHNPSNTEIKCQKSRSQALNRYYARKILASKIENAILGRESEERKRIEKIRRQKRKRSKRAKEKMLDAKRERSEKKDFRRPIGLSTGYFE